jgi:A/G-specific adenine glycosylase
MNEPQPSPSISEKIPAVRADLRAWWHANRRDLPWRTTRDPYRIMVSEVMLQQTQVDRVIPYFEQWLDAFPTVHDLAAAPTAEVIRLWAGLGYNRRAVNLQRTAQAVVERGGSFPESVDELLKLPGIGPYTAGAIACFAFEQDVSFIDTNMRRVLHRLFFGVDVPAPIASDREVLAIATDVLPPGDGWNWNQGLMEFGALHCTARKPLCVICPLQQECAAWPDIQTAIAANARSGRRKEQVPFKQTNRYFRGRIVDTLRDRDHEHTGVAIEDLGPMVREDFAEDHVPWLFELAQGLERDGLAVIAEEAAPYDTSTPIAKVRIKLP